MIPDPRQRPTLTVEEAGALWQLGRSKSYDEARRYLATEGAEGLPTVRFGRALRCPTAAVLRQLGLETTTNDPEESFVADIAAAAKKRTSRGPS